MASAPGRRTTRSITRDMASPALSAVPTEVPSVRRGRRSATPAAKRPVVPVKKSYAYGSPGKVALPGTLDSGLGSKDLVDVMDEAVHHSTDDEAVHHSTDRLAGGTTTPQVTTTRDLPPIEEEPGPSGTGAGSPSPGGNEAGINGTAQLHEKEPPGTQPKISQVTEQAIIESTPRQTGNQEQPEEARQPDRPEAVHEQWTASSVFTVIMDTLADFWSGFGGRALHNLFKWIPIISFLLLCYRFVSPPLPYLSWLDHAIDRVDPVTHRPHTVPLVKTSSLSNWQYEYLTNRIDTMETNIDLLARSTAIPQPPPPLPLRRINFFAPASGVLVDPHLTSPTRHLAPQQKHMFGLVSARPRFTPPDPSNVFRAWDDAGECWCAPEAGGKSQITIILPRKIVPTDLVVEHINMEATLDAAAAPKDLEFWVQILDPVKRESVANAALDHIALAARPDDDSAPSNLSDRFEAQRSLDRTWVRVGKFRYSIYGENPVQTFTLPVRLEEYNVPVTKVAVRTLSSWGDSRHVCIYRLKLHGLLAEPVNAEAEAVEA